MSRLISKDDLHAHVITMLGKRFEPIVRGRWIAGPVAVAATVLLLSGDQ